MIKIGWKFWKILVPSLEKIRDLDKRYGFFYSKLSKIICQYTLYHPTYAKQTLETLTKRIIYGPW